MTFCNSSRGQKEGTDANHIIPTPVPWCSRRMLASFLMLPQMSPWLPRARGRRSVQRGLGGRCSLRCMAFHPGSSGSIGGANFSFNSTVGAPYRVKDGSNRMQVLMAATMLLGHRSSRLGSLGVSEISATALARCFSSQSSPSFRHRPSMVLLGLCERATPWISSQVMFAVPASAAVLMSSLANAWNVAQRPAARVRREGERERAHARVRGGWGGWTHARVCLQRVSTPSGGGWAALFGGEGGEDSCSQARRSA